MSVTTPPLRFTKRRCFNFLMRTVAQMRSSRSMAASGIDFMRRLSNTTWALWSTARRRFLSIATPIENTANATTVRRPNPAATQLKECTATSQNLAPNTEIAMTFAKDPESGLRSGFHFSITACPLLDDFLEVLPEAGEAEAQLAPEALFYDAALQEALLVR